MLSCQHGNIAQGQNQELSCDVFFCSHQRPILISPKFTPAVPHSDTVTLVKSAVYRLLKIRRADALTTIRTKLSFGIHCKYTKQAVRSAIALILKCSSYCWVRKFVPSTRTYRAIALCQAWLQAAGTGQLLRCWFCNNPKLSAWALQRLHKTWAAGVGERGSRVGRGVSAELPETPNPFRLEDHLFLLPLDFCLLSEYEPAKKKKKSTFLFPV